MIAVATARRLANASPGKPRQSDLRRAISTAYYCLFHSLAKDAADLLVGTGSFRNGAAWVQVYRAIDHGAAKQACSSAGVRGFSAQLVQCAAEFVDLQEARHKADYDPTARFTRAYALDCVERAEATIASLGAASRTERRAFAIHLLLRRRP